MTIRNKWMGLCLGLLGCSAWAQDYPDALRYAMENLQGTARFNGMSGAMGAIGGDLSGMSVNPAGGAVFGQSQCVGTLGNFNTANTSYYLGNGQRDSGNRFDLNQVGVVLVIRNYDRLSSFKKFVFGVNYDLVNSFNNGIRYNGTNTQHSIADYFATYANLAGSSPSFINNTYYGDLYFGEQQAYLGYQGYVINAVAGTGGVFDHYASAISTPGLFYQSNQYINTGYNGRTTFNFSTQIENNWYLGLNLNAYFSDYRQSTIFKEINGQVNVNGFYQDLRTYGNGFSFQLGALYKINPQWRVGASYTSPVWYRFSDELSQSLATSNAYVNPRTVMVYPAYQLQTPSNYGVSAAYVYQKTGLISFDFNVKEYGALRFKPKSDPVFAETNSFMDQQLTTANQIRIGWEHKYKMLAFRAGYRWEQSPFVNKSYMSDLTGYSLGLGYQWSKEWRLDAAFAQSQQTYLLKSFRYGIPEMAQVDQRFISVSMSLSYFF